MEPAFLRFVDDFARLKRLLKAYVYLFESVAIGDVCFQAPSPNKYFYSLAHSM